MGIIVLLMVLIVICLLLIMWGRNDYSVEDFVLPIGVVGGMVCTIAFILVLADASTLESQFALIELKYYNLKEQIEQTEDDDIVTGENLRNQVLDMNNTIAEHRSYCDNMWIGMWYSKRIGKLQNLKWKSRKK